MTPSNPSVPTISSEGEVLTLDLGVGCAFDYQSQYETAAVFLVRPTEDDEHRILEERWETSPRRPFHDYRDIYGNVCRRVTFPAGPFSLKYLAHVRVPDEADPVGLDAEQHMVAKLPDDALIYTLPSRYCLSDVLAARAHELFDNTPPGWACVQAISDWVHANIKFAYGTSTATTTSADVLANRHGVCRDFTHLGITFARAMNIPARYVFGYLPDIDVPPPGTPMDFCAWFEAYLGDRWWTFDPRNNQRRKGRVVIARGRDALDVAMVTEYGTPLLKGMTVQADEVSRVG